MKKFRSIEDFLKVHKSNRFCDMCSEIVENYHEKSNTYCAECGSDDLLLIEDLVLAPSKEFSDYMDSYYGIEV